MSEGVLAPSDFFIGVIDFFAILIPGVTAALIIGSVTGTIPQKQELLFFVILLVTGFILGHVLHGIGGLLDPILYDPLFKPRKPADKWAAERFPTGKYFRANDELYGLAIRLTGCTESAAPTHGEVAVRDNPNATVGTHNPPGNMFQWARAWLRKRSREATAEVDRLEADSKLFRSLSVIGLATLIFWQFLPHFRGALPLALLALGFSVWRYCELRRKMVRACYLHYVQLR